MRRQGSNQPRTGYGPPRGSRMAGAPDRGRLSPARRPGCECVGPTGTPSRALPVCGPAVTPNALPPPPQSPPRSSTRSGRERIAPRTRSRSVWSTQATSRSKRPVRAAASRAPRPRAACMDPTSLPAPCRAAPAQTGDSAARVRTAAQPPVSAPSRAPLTPLPRTRRPRLRGPGVREVRRRPVVDAGRVPARVFRGQHLSLARHLLRLPRGGGLDRRDGLCAD